MKRAPGKHKRCSGALAYPRADDHCYSSEEPFLRRHLYEKCSMADMARDFNVLDFSTELDDNHLLDILTSYSR
jgi:hypothetical protein